MTTENNQQPKIAKNNNHIENNEKCSGDYKFPDSFYGKFRLVQSENFDAFLREIGISFVFRKIADLATPELHIIKEPDGYISTKATTPFKSIVNRFRINEYFNETRMDGKVCKSIVEFVPPNKFIQYQWDDKLEIKYIREFVDNKINVTSICNNVESFRVYKRFE